MKEFIDQIEKYTYYKSAELAEELDDYYLLHLNKYGDVVNLIVKSLLLGLGCAFELERKVSQSTVFFDYQSALFKHFLQMVAKLFGCTIRLTVEDLGMQIIGFGRDTAKIPIGSQSQAIELVARSDETLELRYPTDFFLSKGCSMDPRSLLPKGQNKLSIPIRQSWAQLQNLGSASAVSNDTDIAVERLDALQNDYISVKNIYNPQDVYQLELEQRQSMFGSIKPSMPDHSPPHGYIDLSAYYSANIPGAAQPKLFTADSPQPNRVDSLQYVQSNGVGQRGSSQPQLVAHTLDALDTEDPWDSRDAKFTEATLTESQRNLLKKHQEKANFMMDGDLADSGFLERDTVPAPQSSDKGRQSPGNVRPASLTSQIRSLIERSEHSHQHSQYYTPNGYHDEEDGAYAGSLADPLPQPAAYMVQPFSIQAVDIAPQVQQPHKHASYRPLLPETPYTAPATQNQPNPSETNRPAPVLASSTQWQPGPETPPRQYGLASLEKQPVVPNPLQFRLPAPQQQPGHQPAQLANEGATSPLRDKQHQLDLLAKKRPTASVELLQQISDTWMKTKGDGPGIGSSARATLQSQKKLDFSPLEARDSLITAQLTKSPDSKTNPAGGVSRDSAAVMTRKHKFLQNSESEKNCLICSKTQKMTQMYYYDRCFFCSNCYGLLAQRFKSKGLNNCSGCFNESTKILVVKFFLTNPFVKNQGSLLFTREKMMDKYFEYFTTCSSMPVKSQDLDRVLKLISNNVMTKVNTNAEVKVCSTCVSQFHVCSLCKFQIHQKEYFTNGKCDHGYCLDCLTLVFMKKYPHKKEFTCKGSLCWKKTSLDKAMEYLLVKLASLEEEFTGSREPRYSKV